MRGIERTEHTAFVVLLAEHVLRQRKYCRRLARARWTVEEQVRQVARFHGVLQRRHHLAPRTWALAGAPCPARSGVAGVLCAQGAAQGVDANTTESGEQTWSCCWRSSIVAGRYFSTHGASALVTSAGALAVFGSESSISWSSDIVSTRRAARQKCSSSKEKPVGWGREGLLLRRRLSTQQSLFHGGDGRKSALGARWGRAGCAQAAASACASCIKVLAPQMLAGWGRCVVEARGRQSCHSIVQAQQHKSWQLCPISFLADLTARS